MKCNQDHPGFELVSSCPHPATINITPRAPPLKNGLMKPFNCSLAVLSLSLSFCLTCRVNTLVHTILLSNNKCRDYFFYTSSGWLKFACRKPCLTRDEMSDLQIALPRTLMLPFFYTSGTPHARHVCTSFELWGRLFCSSLLVSFFLLMLLWKEFNSHSFVITFHFSHSFSLPPLFYPAVDGCWIHVKITCSTCIYSTPLIVSLNNEPRLAHRRHQSAGSAFQFHYN